MQASRRKFQEDFIKERLPTALNRQPSTGIHHVQQQRDELAIKGNVSERRFGCFVGIVGRDGETQIYRAIQLHVMLGI
jgi:hypothetical protein